MCYNERVVTLYAIVHICLQKKKGSNIAYMEWTSTIESLLGCELPECLRWCVLMVMWKNREDIETSPENVKSEDKIADTCRNSENVRHQ